MTVRIIRPGGLEGFNEAADANAVGYKLTVLLTKEPPLVK